MSHAKIAICRVYTPPSHKEGIWILVDRLWPRGLKKTSLDVDLWLKEISPSPTLRKWFNHDPEKWDEFARRYVHELKDKPELIEQVLEKAKKKPVTLFYAAKDTHHNHALVLQAVLQAWPSSPELKSKK
ncbi:DUF488 domain-containing protein [Legionella cardiaca]|uniref:DUF488 family protein n=1 Tax=Legionella cardiaca TaxID=1071983 RepID=A0ABY8AWR1_9GAMM|nr:DUF488 family protein [Legionella cardiaca]WED44621.1 DUF488 family protein [Legionella cardiaca]